MSHVGSGSGSVIVEEEMVRKGNRREQGEGDGMQGVGLLGGGRRRLDERIVCMSSKGEGKEDGRRIAGKTEYENSV